MSSIRLAALIWGVPLLVLSGSVASEPVRKLVALGHNGVEPKAVAERMAEIATRCWIPQAPEFAGLKFDRIEPGSEPNVYRVVFAEAKKTKTPPRHLRIIVGEKVSATIVMTEQEGVDANEVIGRDARALVKGRPASC